MSCKDRAIQISRFHRGELSDSESNSLLSHLETCKDCRSTERAFKSVHDFLATQGNPAVPRVLSEKIILRWNEDRKRGSYSGLFSEFVDPVRLLQPVFAVGLVLVALMLGNFMGSKLVSFTNHSGLHQQNDVISLVFESNPTDPASFDFVCSDDRGNQ